MVDLGSVLEVALDVGEDVPEEEEAGGLSQQLERGLSKRRVHVRLAAPNDLRGAEADLLVVKIVPIVAEAAKIGV